MLIVAKAKILYRKIHSVCHMPSPGTKFTRVALCFMNLLFDILASRVKEWLKEIPLPEGHLETMAPGAPPLWCASGSSRLGELTGTCRPELYMNPGMAEATPCSLPDGHDRCAGRRRDRVFNKEEAL
jgi:hypothetical protein